MSLTNWTDPRSTAMVNPLDSIRQRLRKPQTDERVKNITTRELQNQRQQTKLQMFIDKLQHADPEYPFPLDGSDDVVIYRGEKQPAWFLAATATRNIAIYTLADGTTVSSHYGQPVIVREGKLTKSVSDFKLADADDATVERIAKRLKRYLSVEKLKAIPRDRWGESLSEHLD